MDYPALWATVEGSTMWCVVDSLGCRWGLFLYRERAEQIARWARDVVLSGTVQVVYDDSPEALHEKEFLTAPLDV